jgi:hypothetical protein
MSDSKLTLMEELPPIDNEPAPQMMQQPPPQQQHIQQPVYSDHAAAAYAPPPQPVAAPPAEQSIYQTVLELATSTVFLKTVLVAAAIVLAVMLFPVEDYVLKYATFAQNLPYAEVVIKALAAGLAVTLIRPPKA